MANLTMLDVDPPPQPPPLAADFDAGISNSPGDDDGFLFPHVIGDRGVSAENLSEVVALEDIYFDFSCDDLCLPFSDEFDHFLNPKQLQQPDLEPGSDQKCNQFPPIFDHLPHAVFKSSPELRHLSSDGDHSSNGSGVLTSISPDMEYQQISGYLNVPSPESNGSNRGSSGNCVDDNKGLNCPSPKSQGSGNCGSNVSGSNNCVARSVSSSPISNNSSVRVGVVDQKVKSENLPNISKVNSSVLKRKKDVDDSVANNNVDSRISKYRKSNCNIESNDNSHSFGGSSEEDEKRKARLMRNKESAQLSRQRKKHYVEELEDKVKNMHATIQDLNAKITYFMAENATLRQQTGSVNGVLPSVAPPPHGMYPHPAMMYPCMPCPPLYMMKPHGTQVPLIPIPKLKPQQPAQEPKASKKADGKKNNGQKTKKVASVSFLGLLFFLMLFGGLVPMVNMRYGGVREAFSGGQNCIGVGFYEKHRGRVLMVNGTEYGENYGVRREFSGNTSVDCGSGGKTSLDEFARLRNGSELLTASLYVPRNDKLVKIDGNLIIHSVLASEKAMSSHGKEGGETGLAVPRDLSPSIPVQEVGMSGTRHPQLRSAASDGKLQQWFREGLAGPMLSSGMCTEVFQFDVSSAIVPATTTTSTAAASSRNISKEQNQNSTYLGKGKNRRILHGLPIPLPDSTHNISKEHATRNPHKDNLNANSNMSSMVVSVLVDPREVGDADADSVMGTKSLSRIFVVVLIDSVKYVTYSCMLPFMGSAPHLMT